MKIKRGQKLCVNCNTINGVRSFNCKSCGNAFKMKKGIFKKSPQKVEDYTLLQKGDRIKIVGGSGPYYTTKDGIRHYFTDRGKYTVDKIVHNGIIAHGKCGIEFFYMGPIQTSPILKSIVRSPHKIKLIRQLRDRVDEK